MGTPIAVLKELLQTFLINAFKQYQETLIDVNIVMITTWLIDFTFALPVLIAIATSAPHPNQFALNAKISIL